MTLPLHIIRDPSPLRLVKQVSSRKLFASQYYWKPSEQIKLNFFSSEKRTSCHSLALVVWYWQACYSHFSLCFMINLVRWIFFLCLFFSFFKCLLIVLVLQGVNWCNNCLQITTLCNTHFVLGQYVLFSWEFMWVRYNKFLISSSALHLPWIFWKKDSVENFITVVIKTKFIGRIFFLYLMHKQFENNIPTKEQEKNIVSFSKPYNYTHTKKKKKKKKRLTRNYIIQQTNIFEIIHLTKAEEFISQNNSLTSIKNKVFNCQNNFSSFIFLFLIYISSTY